MADGEIKFLEFLSVMAVFQASCEAGFRRLGGRVLIRRCVLIHHSNRAVSSRPVAELIGLDARITTVGLYLYLFLLLPLSLWLLNPGVAATIWRGCDF